jgi:phosphinothricin acetyltransferase
MSGFECRLASTRDAATIAEIYREHVLHGTATFETEPPDVAEILRRMEAVRQLGLPYLVAEYAGDVIGYAYAGQFRPRPAYRFTVEDSIYIAPAHVGRGLGGLLLRELMTRSLEAGARQMIAVMGGENRASVALHARHGFAHAGVLREVGFKFDQWLDVTLMQRAL